MSPRRHRTRQPRALRSRGVGRCPHCARRHGALMKGIVAAAILVGLIGCGGDAGIAESASARLTPHVVALRAAAASGERASGLRGAGRTPPGRHRAAPSGTAQRRRGGRGAHGQRRSRSTARFADAVVFGEHAGDGADDHHDGERGDNNDAGRGAQAEESTKAASPGKAREDATTGTEQQRRCQTLLRPQPATSDRIRAPS